MVRDSGSPNVGWVRLTVEDGSPTGLVVLEDGTVVPEPDPSEYPTVTGLFDILEEAVDQEAHSINVTWDPTFGFPTTFFIDYSLNIADEELGYDVRAFQPQS